MKIIISFYKRGLLGEKKNAGGSAATHFRACKGHFGKKCAPGPSNSANVMKCRRESNGNSPNTKKTSKQNEQIRKP